MLEILLLPFIQRAFIAGIFIAFLGSYFGAIVVQRKISFIGDGLAHSAFGGVALGLLLGIEPLYIAIPFSIIVSLLITYIKDKTDLSTDASIGIMFAVSVALGIVFLSYQKNFSTDAFAYLFGSILSVSNADVILSGILTLCSIFTFSRLWSEWSYSTFDEELSLTDGIRTKRNDYILSVFFTLTIVISIKIVGIVLVSAFLVIPAATSRLISKTFYKMTIFSIIFGILSLIIGLILSFLMDLPSGAVIILTQSLFFAIVFLKKIIIKNN